MEANFDLNGRISPRVRECPGGTRTAASAEPSVPRYYETVSDVLQSVRKVEESLKRLKQARKSTPAHAAGPGGGMSDDDKIRLQLALDVAHLGEQVTGARRPSRALRPGSEGPWGAHRNPEHGRAKDVRPGRGERRGRGAGGGGRPALTLRPSVGVVGAARPPVWTSVRPTAAALTGTAVRSPPGTRPHTVSADQGPRPCSRRAPSP